jgi:hypothetical protein
MARYRKVAAVATVLTAALLIALVAARSPADTARRPQAHRAATPRSTVAGEFLFGPSQLMDVAGIGRFVVDCRSQHRLVTTFRSSTDETIFLTVDRGGARPRSAVVDPGKRFVLPAAPGHTATQRWQLAGISEAGSSVALVFISSNPAYGRRELACAISAYAIGPTEQPRTP